MWVFWLRLSFVFSSFKSFTCQTRDETFLFSKSHLKVSQVPFSCAKRHRKFQLSSLIYVNPSQTLINYPFSISTISPPSTTIIPPPKLVVYFLSSSNIILEKLLFQILTLGDLILKLQTFDYYLKVPI